MATNYEKLEVWQKSMGFVKEIYVLTSKFPAEERFGIVSQIRRAVVSIPVNIAEGSGRGTQISFCSFIYIARGSAYEVETLLNISYTLKFLSKELFLQRKKELQEIIRMLNGLINSLQKKPLTVNR